MTNIRITMRDGTKKEFLHKGRTGGSFTKKIRYEPGVAIITDEYYRETVIPMELISEIIVDNN
jgi:hypothetical protein